MKTDSMGKKWAKNTNRYYTKKDRWKTHNTPNKGQVNSNPKSKIPFYTTGLTNFKNYDVLTYDHQVIRTKMFIATPLAIVW